MRLVMTLRTRDNEDIVSSHLAFHLNAGVDFVIATDHCSVDSTREILREHELSGHLTLICKDEEQYVPGEWVNDMARLAATEHSADWVIHSDADEFWWPRGGNLKEVLGAVPARFGALFGVWRHFAARPEDGSHFAERMTLRLASHGPWTSPDHPFHPNVNVAHRGEPDVSIRIGNHDVEMRLPVLRGWFPFEVLHFPLRTIAQAQAKFEAWGRTVGIDHGPHVDAASASLRSGRFQDHYERYVVHDDSVVNGIRAGTFTVDTRVRDALRRLAGNDLEPVPPHPRSAFCRRGSVRLEFPRFGITDEAALADDVSVLPEPWDRVHRRVEQFEHRLARRERSLAQRTISRISRSGSRFARSSRG
jgi:hypothetical protein